MKLRNLFLAGFLISLGIANASEITLPSGSAIPVVVTIGTSVGQFESVWDAPIFLKITNGKLENCSAVALIRANWSTNKANAKVARLQCKSGNEIKGFDMQGWIVDSDNKAGIHNGSNSNEIMNVNAGIKAQIILSKLLTINIESK